MTEFERLWSDLYFVGKPLVERDKLDIYLNEELDEEEKLTALTCSKGRTRVSITVQTATELTLEKISTIENYQSFKLFLSKRGIQLHSPDNIYFSSKPSISGPIDSALVIRPLYEKDESLYSKFTSGIDPMELDNAWVELDHWIVYGLFFHGHLVSACSLYPWQETNIADLGVITSPDYRNMGFARMLVEYVHQKIAEEGYILQYRTQTDNYASIKLAESLDLNFFGIWEPALEVRDD